jgi:hypothetical protein
MEMLALEGPAVDSHNHKKIITSRYGNAAWGLIKDMTDQEGDNRPRAKDLPARLADLTAANEAENPAA